MDRKELHVSLKCEEAILHMKGINPNISITASSFKKYHCHLKNVFNKILMVRVDW